MSLVDEFADFAGSVKSRVVDLPFGPSPVWELGRGRPVVLLHGIAGSRRIFFRLAPLLARANRVLVPLLRGEDRPMSNFDHDDLLDDLGALLASLDLREASLLGVSFGGTIALAYGARRDPRVAAIVAQGAFAHFPLRPLDRLALALSRAAPAGLASAYFARRVLRGRETPLLEARAPGLGSLNADWTRQTPFATLRRRIQIIDAVDHAAAIRADRTPLTLARGRLDRVVPEAFAERLRQLRPDARAVTWEDEGHLVALTAPKLLAELI